MSEAEARKLLEKNILICGGASIGVSLLPSLVSHMKSIVPEIKLRILLTENAKTFVSCDTLATLTGHPVYSTWPLVDGTGPYHIQLAEWADLVLVLPATANLLAKASHGIADDIVTTSFLAVKVPIIFVPSMNPSMWSNPVVQDNVMKLRNFNYHVMDPSEGVIASSGQIGIGAVPPLRDILVFMLTALSESAA